MKAKTITFCYRSENNIKVGDLIGLLCEKYEASDILEDGDILSLGNLEQKVDDKPLENPEERFNNYLFKVENEAEDLIINFTHTGTKNYSSTVKIGDSTKYVSYKADEISAFDTSNATLIGICSYIGKIYGKIRVNTNYTFTIKFFDKDENKYAELSYKSPEDFKAFIIKYKCNVTEDDIKKEAQIQKDEHKNYSFDRPLPAISIEDL